VKRVGRGSTRTGQPAVMPVGGYQPPPTVGLKPEGLVVEFHGEDHRRATVHIDRMPLPAWHAPLAAAIARRIGPAGGRRTLASATQVWMTAERLLRFLDQLDDPPADPGRLTAAHLDGFYRRRTVTSDPRYVWREVRELGMLLEQPPLRAQIAQEVVDYISRRAQVQASSRPGYSDGELSRLLAAARRHVAAIRDRIQASERLLAAFLAGDGSLTGTELLHGQQLAKIAATGEVPRILPGLGESNARLAVAERLFLTRRDLLPLLVLLVAVTGRNLETVKELPAEHRILEDQAVELGVVKRRRGQRNWHQTVSWEIGPPHRELHTPGGLYLLIHRLTARSRAFSGNDRLWSIWRHGLRIGVAGVDEHYDPFARALSAASIRYREWITENGLVADAPDGDDPAGERQSLTLDFNRLRTSIEVRRTKQMGGHLPSAVRSNTVPVLFRHYLRGDPTVTSWAEDVIGEAVLDAEQAALAAHDRALRTAGGVLRVIPGPPQPASIEQVGVDPHTAQQAATGALETGWSACTNHASHPATGRPCQASFLDCFHCGNCLITRDHLPKLLGLLDALNHRREQLAEATWWARYGPAWAAIRRDVLTRFTPAEVREAERRKPTDSILDLVENPWEAP
jgi:hypothetical protein